MGKRHAAIPALILLVALGADACATAISHPASHADQQLLFRLYDQGSTNTPTWILTVNTDGSGALTNDSAKSGHGNKRFAMGTFNARSLAAALDKLDYSRLPTCSGAEAVAPVIVNTGSASFGSFAFLAYKSKLIKSFCSNSPVESEISKQLSEAITVANP